MNRETLEITLAYTHNLRPVYSSKVKAEINVIADDTEGMQLEFPVGTDLSAYKKGATLYIVGDEYLIQTRYEVNSICGVYTRDGLKTFNFRTFIGSSANAGFHIIKSVVGNVITLETSADDTIEETFVGLVFLSAWTKNMTQLKRLDTHISAASFGDGLSGESVKNYSYTKSGNSLDASTGLPKEILIGLKQFKKLPQTKFNQIKEMVYA